MVDWSRVINQYMFRFYRDHYVTISLLHQLVVIGIAWIRMGHLKSVTDMTSHWNQDKKESVEDEEYRHANLPSFGGILLLSRHSRHPTGFMKSCFWRTSKIVHFLPPYGLSKCAKTCDRLELYLGLAGTAYDTPPDPLVNSPPPQHASWTLNPMPQTDASLSFCEVGMSGKW